MMRNWRILTMAAASLILVACGGEEASSEGEEQEEVVVNDGHEVQLDIIAGDGQMATLAIFEEGKEIAIDSAVINGGRATLKTQTKDLRQYVLQIGAGQPPVVLLLDRFSENIKITANYADIQNTYEVEGSEPSQELKEYLEFISPNFDTERSLRQELVYARGDEKRTEEIFEALDTIFQRHRAYVIEQFKSDSTSPSRWVMLGGLIPPRGLEAFDSTDLQYHHMISNGMRDRYPTSRYPDYIDQSIASIEAQLQQIAIGWSDGSFEVAPEITLNDVDGKELKLSSLRGKVVLIDFWASWCAPCRKENPNVVKAYDKWKDKGFTVYSVSLDEDKGKWQRAITSDNLKWPNHVSDLKGWMSPVVAQYGVQGIPATFLIDGEGKIIGRNLRGSALEQKLQEVLG